MAVVEVAAKQRSASFFCTTSITSWPTNWETLDRAKLVEGRKNPTSWWEKTTWQHYERHRYR